MSWPASFGACISTRLVDDGILVITIDNPPVNAASAEMRAGLMDAVKAGETDEAVRGIVITGTGKSFVGGADIREFGKPMAEPLLPQVVQAIEDCSKPVVAAINGVALGGGAEIALACHKRIAAKTARIGLPEVKLGLVPGAGGTQRLPRLIGIERAIDMVTSGKPATATEALSIGLVDAIADGDLVQAAIHAVNDGLDNPIRRTGQLAIQPVGDAVLDAIRSKLTQKTRGQTAPLEALRLVAEAATRNLADGLTEERRTFVMLRDGEQSKALRHVFFAERAAGKAEDLTGVEPRKLTSIGIVGLGLMGSGIASACLDAGYHVIGVDRDAASAEAGRARIAGLIDRAVKSGRMDEAGMTERLARLTTTDDRPALAQADMVLEAVFDDLTVKTDLFVALDGIVRPDAILATNTSYLDPDRIAAATARPARILGLHFFSPANIMRLIEVVRCAATAPDVLATGLDFARKLGKLPILTGVTEGFIGNRIFSAYRREAEFLLEDGAAPEGIDAALEGFGMAMGPFAVFDMAGLEIAWARRKREAATRDPATRYVDIADRLCEAGRFGQKSGAGWYAYPDGKRTVDPVVTAMIAEARAAKGIVARSIEAEEMVARLLAAMADEGERLLAEGIAARASDIDLVLINGYGFPAHKGGPMFLRDSKSD